MRRGKKKLWTAAMAVTLGAGLVFAPIGAQAHHMAEAGVALENVASISGGWMHTCALTTDGAVWCWGGNATGQLGDGLVGTARPTPRRVNNLNTVQVTQISTGADHSCAVTSTQDVWCWGGNMMGQIGRSTNLGVAQTTPAQLDVRDQAGNTVKFTAVSAGNAHTCAIATTGVPWCWGADDEGQLGRNNPMEGPTAPAPVDTRDMGTVRAISAGAEHTCAIGATGKLWCWGGNTDGRLGVGDTTRRRKPTLVEETNGFPAGGVTQVIAATNHTCAATNSKSVYCWGNNDFGRIGNPAGESSRVPIKVQGHIGIVKHGNSVDFKADRIALGIEHSCAMRDNDGMAWCWGRGAMGQLGDGQPSTSVTLPRYRVKGETILMEATGPIRSLGAGYNHTCSVNEGNVAFCWGMNSLGQLGESTFANHAEPAMVLQPL